MANKVFSLIMEPCQTAQAEHSQVRWVVSWPPPWVPVPMNVVTALPTSEPFCHSEPVASQNALNWAAGEPYLRYETQRGVREGGWHTNNRSAHRGRGLSTRIIQCWL